MLLITSMLFVVFAHSSKKPLHATTSFSFTAVGDYAQTTKTTANLKYIATSGASFNLALGDIDESTGASAAQWSSKVKSLLPPNFPFEIIPGDHDASQVSTYAADLPDHLGSTGTYAEQYYFNFPSTGPLARFIMLAPSSISGINYTKGSAGYNWVSSTIDSARAAHIPWVIVGMYENCFSIGSQHCSKDDVLNLLVSKKVDLILYAHKHDYQASKQLAFNGTTCTSLTSTYNANCVVNATSSMTRGAGSAILIAGTGGAPMISISATDPAIGFFRSWEASNINQTWGVTQFTISSTSLSERFVGVSGSFSDSFTIQ
jgi:hypothetical protein